MIPNPRISYRSENPGVKKPKSRSLSAFVPLTLSFLVEFMKFEKTWKEKETPCAAVRNSCYKHTFETSETFSSVTACSVPDDDVGLPMLK